MKIFIAGDGETGSHLAEVLSVGNQDVILMGSDREKLKQLDSSLNFLAQVGSLTSMADLESCGIGDADLFVAVTPDDNANLIGCEMAKTLGASTYLARVNNPELAEDRASAMLRRFGVDVTIYPERLAADSVLQFIRHSWTCEWFRLNSGEFRLVGVRVNDGAPLAGHCLHELGTSPRFFHIAAIKRGDSVIIPRGDDRVLPGDTLYVSILPHDASRFHRFCSREMLKPNRIMVTGGGRITANLLTMIDGELSVTVLEPDKDRCRTLAAQFPWATIVHSRSDDVGTMKEEGIGRCDMFLALTGSAEANIVSCMVARAHGVKKTLARIEEFQYIEEAESLHIDKIINKKQLNAGKVMNIVLDSPAGTTQCVASDKAEVTVMAARPGTKIVARPISGLSLPKGMTIAGVIRGDKAILAEGSTRIIPGDKVVVFFLTGLLAQVKKIFK